MPQRRRRLQIQLRPEDERILILLRRVYGPNESEAGHRLLLLFEHIVETIDQGGVWVKRLAAEQDALDALPEITRRLRPEARYRFLVSLPHVWRRQLMFKGRRISVGNFIGQMQANGWDPEEAARQFDLDYEAVLEALEYYAQNRTLIDLEAAEERRRAQLSAAPARSPLREKPMRESGEATSRRV